MADISKITIESGTYDIKDSTARSDIISLNTSLSEDIAEVNTSILSKMTNSEKPSNMNNVVFIGDSYGELSGQTTWIDTVISKLGITSSDYTRQTEGSTGFLSYNSSTNHTFIDLLQLVQASLTSDERAEVTHIIVCGGANDMKPQYDVSGLTTAISQFINYAESNFTNAKVYIGMIGFTTDPTVKKYLGRVLEAYQKCINYGGIYLNGVQNVSHYYPYFNLTTSNTVHPNQSGSTAIGNGVYEALIRGSVEVMRNWELVSDNISYGHLYSYSNNDNYKIKWTSGFRFNAPSSTMVLSPTNPIEIMSFNGGCVGGVADTEYMIQGTILIQCLDDSVYKCNGTYRITSYVYSGDGVTIRQKIEFYPYEIDTSGSGVNGYKQITNAQRIWITPNVLDMSIYDC